MSVQNRSNSLVCGVCRAFGASNCHGHGSHFSDEKRNETQHNLLQHRAAAKQFLEVAPIIGGDWKLIENKICLFDKFNKNSAIACIEINPSQCMIIFVLRKNLQVRQIDDVKELFAHIRLEAEQKSAKVSISESGLMIDASKIPNHFSDLLSNLLALHLLPAKASDLDVQAIGQKACQAPVPAQAYVPSVVNWPPTPPGFRHTSHDEEEIKY